MGIREEEQLLFRRVPSAESAVGAGKQVNERTSSVGENVRSRVRSPVFQEAAGENAGVHGPVEERKEKVPSPHLSQLVVLTNSGTLYGLAQRVVATESL